MLRDIGRLPERSVVEAFYSGTTSQEERERAVWAEDVVLDDEGRARFTLCAKGFIPDETEFGEPTLFNMEPDTQRCSCHLSLRGIHNVGNACASASVGLWMGIPIEEVAQALSASVPESGRMETLVARDGFTVINDTYNASPDSMRASLSSFCAMNVPGRRIAVLGDMGELGDIAKACHEGIGRFAATLPLDELICVGELSSLIARCAREAGMDPSKIVEVRSIGGALEALESRLSPDDAVLVKASHFMELDRLVEGLVS